MAFFKSLKELTRNLNSKTFLTATASSSIPYPYTPLSSFVISKPFLFHRTPYRFLSPLSKWVLPFQGPLFLSSPPWKLSQSATPLYLQGNGLVLKKVQALNHNLNLLRSSTRLPIELTFGSSSSTSVVLDGSSLREEGRNELFDSFVNFPNLISVGRMISGPFLGWMIVNQWYTSAFIGLAISGATDWLDGYVARKMKINSVVGSYLDPLADKVLIGCVALAMVHDGLLHPGLVGLVVLRDTVLVGGAVYQRASSLGWEWKSWSDFFNLDKTCPQKVEPLLLSKVNTVFQLVLVAAALLQPDFGTQETQSYITYLSWLVASTTVGSTAAYGAQHMRKRAALITRK